MVYVKEGNGPCCEGCEAELSDSVGLGGTMFLERHNETPSGSISAFSAFSLQFNTYQ